MTFDLKKALLDGSTWATGPKKDAYFAALDRILELESALIEERAKQMCVDEPCPGRKSYEFCELLDDTCDGYPSMWHACPRKKEKLAAAMEQLHSEGKI